MGHPGHENRAHRGAGPGSLRSRVFAFLDSQIKIEDYFDIGDGDDPYLLWMTARGLGVGVDAIAEHVRDWCRQAAQRDGQEFIPTRP